MLKEIIQGEDNVVEAIFIDILNRIHLSGPNKADDFETLSYIKKFHEQLFSKYEKKLLYLIGLFYKVGEPASLIEKVYSIYSESIVEETGRVFTPPQADAYKKIQQKLFFSFSAPTSAGKSYLFRDLIRQAEKDIVIVVPSRALIAEYIQVVTTMVDKSVLVLQFVDNINISKVRRRVFIITPERGTELFSHSHEFDVGLFLLDEAQISEEEVRGLKFDSFVRRIDKVFPLAKKVFAHPFVHNPEAQLKKHKFEGDIASSRYDQNAVGKIFMCSGKDGLNYFSPYKSQRQFVSVDEDIIESTLNNNGTVLVYISKKKIYDRLYLKQFASYIALCPKLTDHNALNLINELKEFIGVKNNSKEKHSLMIEMMEKGIVIHHGSMPLKARLLIEKFVRANYAKICFATSTLNQGINMPFDVVLIDNFTSMDTLTLKNLIGRAGRSTNKQDSFDFGYAIIKKSNVNTFSKRLEQHYTLSETSTLDVDYENIPEDLLDLVEAVKYDHFNDDYKLTDTQIVRLNSTDIYDAITFILDSLLLGDRPLTTKEYYHLTNTQRDKIKKAFKDIYIQHLRRSFLTQAEMGVLSTAIPIMLWHIQGKSFRESVSLRYAFLTEKDKQREVRSRLRKKLISPEQATDEIRNITVRYSPIAIPIPNINATQVPLFRKTSVNNVDYDVLIYDTYDYLDKVIALSLSDPLCAAFDLYYNNTNDERAISMKNYIRYGTNNNQEIWLLRYGFGFEDIEWIIDYIDNIDEYGISFNESVKQLDETRRATIERYL